MSKNKSVLYIIDNFIYGGVTTFVRQYCEMAHSLGYTCTIIGFSGDMENPKREFPLAQVIVIPKSMHHGSFLGRIIDGIYYTQALHNFYKSCQPSAVHLATTWSSLFALALPSTWKARRVITFYGAYDKEYLSMAMHKETLAVQIKMLVMKLLQTATLNASSAIVTFSKFAEKQIRTSFSLPLSKNIFIIPGTLSRIPTQKTRVFGSRLTALWIGRAEPRKGVTTLLQAIALLKQQNIYIKTIIASPVEYYRNYYIMEDYEKLNLGLDIHFVHKANSNLQKALFEQSDIFIMPSQELETFGMTMIESLSRGVPVIGTPVGAIPEILSKIDKRLITKDTTPESIRTSLAWYCSLAKKERVSLSQKSILYIQKHHAPILYKDQLGKIYSR